MKTLFLDIDGVLATDKQYNSNNKKWDPRFNVYGFDPKCVKVLNKILDMFDLDIILSSDWKTHYTLEEMNNIFELNTVNGKIKDKTPNLWGVKYKSLNQLEECRANEILEYVEKHNITDFLAIDDLDLTEWLPNNFIQTPKSNEGIKQSGIKDKIINFLNSEK